MAILRCWAPNPDSTQTGPCATGESQLKTPAPGLPFATARKPVIASACVAASTAARERPWLRFASARPISASGAATPGRHRRGDGEQYRQRLVALGGNRRFGRLFVRNRLRYYVIGLDGLGCLQRIGRVENLDSGINLGDRLLRRNVGRDVLPHDHMRVGAAETEPGDTGNRSTAVARPIRGLGNHLQELPEELREPFAAEVVRRSGEPFRLDYVRLNITARAA